MKTVKVILYMLLWAFCARIAATIDPLLGYAVGGAFLINGLCMIAHPKAGRQS